MATESQVLKTILYLHTNLQIALNWREIDRASEVAQQIKKALAAKSGNLSLTPRMDTVQGESGLPLVIWPLAST